MTRFELIVAGHPPHPVRVERKTRRPLTRGEIHRAGLAAVASALGDAGGSLDGEDRARLLMGGRRAVAGIPASASASNHVEKRDIGCEPTCATKPENQPDLSTGTLADDVSRHIRSETGTFGRELWGEIR